MKIFIGITGEKGSGKDTFAQLFEEILQENMPQLSVGRCRSSDILAETLTIWNLPRTRHNLQQIAISMGEGFGKGTLTAALKERILTMKQDIVLFDAVRWASDMKMTRSFPQNFLVYITAPQKIRYERTRARKEKVGEATATFDQFLEEEKVATEVEISKIGAQADVIIENQGTTEQFKALVREFYQQKVKSLCFRL